MFPRSHTIIIAQQPKLLCTTRIRSELLPFAGIVRIK
jgi:hypothetical protein